MFQNVAYSLDAQCDKIDVDFAVMLQSELTRAMIAWQV